jgi:thioredoxin-like negative regulator of GroEL
MDKIQDQFDEEILIGQVNIDDEPQLSDQEQIEVIPTFVLYKGGKAVASIVAPESKAAIESFIREGLQ